MEEQKKIIRAFDWGIDDRRNYIKGYKKVIREVKKELKEYENTRSVILAEAKNKIISKEPIKAIRNNP